MLTMSQTVSASIIMSDVLGVPLVLQVCYRDTLHLLLHAAGQYWRCLTSMLMHDVYTSSQA